MEIVIESRGMLKLLGSGFRFLWNLFFKKWEVI